MTTYYPEKVFVCRRGASTSSSTEYILDREYTTYTRLSKADNEYFLAIYDAPSWGIHQVGRYPDISFTYQKKPSGTASVDVSIFKIRTITGSVQVGNSVFVKYTNGGNMLATLPEDGKAYVIVYPNAYDSDGYWISSQDFIVSGFGLTFTASGSYPFAAETDFAGGYKNPSKAFSITVAAHYYTDLLKQYELDSAVFYYKETTDPNYTTVPMSGFTVTIPAGTLTAGSDYDIYFDATDTEGTTVQCGAAVITTTDGPAVVTPVTPINEVVHSAVRFGWNYSNEIGEPQLAFDLDTSTDGTTWTAEASHEVTAETFHETTIATSGTMYWRVRGYNQSDVAGEWSAAVSFVNVVPPQAPTIVQIIPGGRISVQWSSADQSGYRIQVLQEGAVVYDSGATYGTTGTARVNYYLPNGSYTIRVKIFNQYGLESAWVAMNYNQQAELPELGCSAQYSGADGGVRFTITSTGFVKYYLHRNGVLVAKFTDPEYVDRFASGSPEYRLVAVNAQDNFAQKIFVVEIPIDGAKLVTETGETLSVAERWEGLNTAEQTEEIRYSANEYLGATAPEHVFSRMRSKRITRAFYDPDRISAQLLGKLAFYTDEYGNADWVAITGRSRSDSWIGDETTIEMQLTSQSGVITYDD